MNRHHRVGWVVVVVCADSADAGGAQKFGKHADNIFEHYLINVYFVPEKVSREAQIEVDHEHKI